MSDLFSSTRVLTFFISALPVSELRGGIPFALTQGIVPLEAYLISIAGNMLPVFPLLLFFKRVSLFLRQYEKGRKILIWMARRSREKEAMVNRWGFIGLVLLVAVPLPITGAYTGSLVSFFLGLPIKYAGLAIFIGVCIAGIVVLFSTLGLIEGLKVFGM
jgi:uncharacterized membrane protein